MQVPRGFLGWHVAWIDGDATMEQFAIRLPKPMLAAIDEVIAGRLDQKNRSDLIREIDRRGS